MLGESREDKREGNHMEEDMAAEEAMVVEDAARKMWWHTAEHPQLTRHPVPDETPIQGGGGEGAIS